MRVGLAAVALAVALGTGVAGWGLRALLGDDATQVEASTPALYTVVEGAVGRSILLDVTAQWPVVEKRAVGASGTITSLAVSSGTSVQTGDVIATVDLRPVTVAEGAIPAFRDLSRRASGADVAQLQQMLTDLGYYSGSVDATFGAGTESALKAWQRHSGLTADGVLHLGDVVYVSSLPAVISLESFGEVGDQVGAAGGLEVLGDEPSLTLALQEEQVDLVLPGTAVEVHVSSDVSWTLTVARTVAADGVSHAVLAGADGGPVCTDDCGLIAQGDASTLSARVAVVPDTTGPVVPAAAVGIDGAGQAYVLDKVGERLAVKVLASQGGLDVVDGLDLGEVILLDPAAEASDT